MFLGGANAPLFFGEMEMFDYFVNVLLTISVSIIWWVVYVVVAIGVYVLCAEGKLFNDDGEGKKTYIRSALKINWAILVLIVIIGLISPSNTYKHSIHDSAMEVHEMKLTRPSVVVSDKEIKLESRLRKTEMKSMEQFDERFNEMTDWRTK